MATVDSRTRISIDELVEGTVVSGYVTSAGVLILVTRGGAEINAGFLAAQPIRENWIHTSNYKVGDVVGYAGTLWRAKIDHTNKAPFFYTSIWTRVTGDHGLDWVEFDSYFDGDSLADAWSTFWKIGNPVVSLTNIAGEFESGTQGLKIVLQTGEKQNLIPVVENVISTNDEVVVEVRAKLLTSSFDARLNVGLLQNDKDGLPLYFVPGAVLSTATIAPVTLSTSFQTYTFRIPVDPTKPRAVITVEAEANDSGATFLVDFVRVNPIATSEHTHDAGDLVSGTISDNILPARIHRSQLVFDWDEVKKSGVFHCLAGADNSPGPLAYMARVEAHHDGNWVTQTAWQYTGDSAADTRRWRRDYNNAVWGTWYRLRQSQAELDALYASVDDIVDYEQEFEITSATNSWVIPHMQGTKALNVYTEDSLGNPLNGDVSYPDEDHIQVDFYHSQTGLARVFT